MKIINIVRATLHPNNVTILRNTDIMRAKLTKFVTCDYAFLRQFGRW